ncbi:MAG: AraC family transcriptional regulator [Myxococcales bacterium]|nr:AraC family transcriptional regulator [Myxococcales bacterium]
MPTDPSTATLTLPGTDRLGLSVCSTPSPPPPYSDALYRLHLATADAALTLDAVPVQLPRGHLLTLSPGEEVRFGPGARLRSMAFHHDFFCVRVRRDEVFCDGVVFNRVASAPVVPFPAEEQPLVVDRLQELARIVASEGALRNERAANALKALLLHAAEVKLNVTTPEDPPRRLSEVVLAFQEQVEQSFREHKDVAFYCRALGVTAVTLGRHLKRELGKTALQVINERVAIEARAALRSGERSVKEVAFDLGFQDPLYFSRFFKKQFGAPPTQYFREHGGEGRG